VKGDDGGSEGQNTLIPLDGSEDDRRVARLLLSFLVFPFTLQAMCIHLRSMDYCREEGFLRQEGPSLLVSEGVP
jgi:hypothetical protein